MAGFWGKRKRDVAAEVSAQDSELIRQAGIALVTADERIRTTTDELEFARMEFGGAATDELAKAIDAVRLHLKEAYALNQLNHDEIPDTPQELKTRNARIIQLCEWAENLLDERTEALAERVALTRQAPTVIAHIRREADALTERIPGAEEIVTRLRQRYATSLVAQVENNTTEASNLISLARRCADVSEERKNSDRKDDALTAIETATEAIRRAKTILDSIEDVEIEALRAETTLADVVADSRSDLIAARSVPQSPRITKAAAALEQALASLSPAGKKPDPFAELTALRTANTELDAAVAQAIERSKRPVHPIETVRHGIDDADRQLSVARNLIDGHRGWIGSDARTRLAEAQRLRADIEPLIVPEDTREQALALSRRVASLASEAIRLAQRDIDSTRPRHDGRGNGRHGGGHGLDGMLGGLLIGGLLGSIFD